MNNPNVSIIIRAYNRKEFLPLAIRSALNQTYQDFEVVVVDDGSEIDIEKVIKRFNSEKIKYIKIPHSGHKVALKVGIDIAQGNYITFLDSDDMYFPNNLNTQLKHIGNSTFAIASGSYKVITPTNMQINYKNSLERRIFHKNCKEVNYETIYKTIFFSYGFLLPSSTIVKTKQPTRSSIQDIAMNNISHFFEILFILESFGNGKKKICFYNDPITFIRFHSKEKLEMKYIPKECDEIMRILKIKKIKTSLRTNIIVYTYFILSTFKMYFLLGYPSIFSLFLTRLIYRIVRLFFILLPGCKDGKS